MIAQQVAAANCYVDIYPYEGGTVTLQGGDLLSVTTYKSLREDKGTFRIVLAPALVNQTWASWSQYITPSSLVVIGLRIGGQSQITMIGIVKRTIESQKWETGKPTERSVIIEGEDFSYYFATPDYFSLWYVAAIGADQSSFSTVAAGLQVGNPAAVGETWYKTIMAEKVLGSTKINYQNSLSTFESVMASMFEQYDASVPYGDYYVGMSGSWFEKFRKIFPMPFYEFFVTTDQGGNSYGESGGLEFTNSGLGAAFSAVPAVVARINPLPQLVSTGAAGGAVQFNSIDCSKWNALPAVDASQDGFTESNVFFTEAEVYNFYAINPTFLAGLYGANNGNVQPWLFNYSAAIDAASLARYGYRPMIFSTSWFADPTGASAQQTNNDPLAVVATLLGRLCGYFEPAVLMARSTFKSWLRPEVQIGTKFTYVPFRDNAAWDFYVESVTHEYVFGGPSTTTLGLTRGLPSDVYADQGAGGKLFNVHIGNAQRVNGEYQIGLPAGAPGPLTGIAPVKFNQWMLQINQAFVTPQFTVPQQG